MKTHNLSQLAIVYVLVRGLIGNPRNARTHSKRQIRQIAASMRTFGFTNPVLIDRGSRIIAGHGRVEAAKLLGIEQVPAILLENLTEDQIRAYILADNRLAEQAGWDREILAIELQHVHGGFRLSGMGWTAQSMPYGILFRRRVNWANRERKHPNRQLSAFESETDVENNGQTML